MGYLSIKGGGVGIGGNHDNRPAGRMVGFGIGAIHKLTFIEHTLISTGVRLIMMSKAQCVLFFENCTTEGRGGEKGNGLEV